jgi:hypothetical protein
MTYDKEFEEMIKRVIGVCTTDEKKMIYFGWTEARKDHYRIGEWASVWDGAPEWASSAMAVWYGKDGQVAHSQDYTRTLPKSRIDEIAEEAEDKYRRGAVGAGSLTDIIKSAILKDREEREANR